MVPGKLPPVARWAAVLALLTSMGCVKTYATNAVADALAGSGGVYASDEDPELVAQAVPFALKTMEGVLVERPEHRGLLTALASGFVQYAYAFVEQEADAMAEQDLDRALVMRKRTRKLYHRALDYALRGLEAGHQGFRGLLPHRTDEALRLTDREDVPLLYWTAAAWALSISTAKSDPEALANLPLVRKIAERALELDESWNRGAIHDLFISIEAGFPTGDLMKAREHYARALELNGGKRAGTYVALAESVSVKEQKSREFHRLLARARALDVDESPEDRLANVIMQRRAERLEALSEDLFLEDETDEVGTSTVSTIGESNSRGSESS